MAVPGVLDVNISSAGSTCTISACQDGASTCPCRNIFGVQCGSFTGTLTVIIEAASLQNATAWLQLLGLANVQTVNALYIRPRGLDGVPTASWSLDIFPQLEVVTTSLRVIANYPQATTFFVLKGPGLGKLRAVGEFVTIDRLGKVLNTDLGFLAGLQCWGARVLVDFQQLRSLNGLAQVADGGESFDFACTIQNTASTTTLLSDVSALAAVARCGSVPPRMDGFPSQPCLRLKCGAINNWSQLCSRLASGVCA